MLFGGFRRAMSVSREELEKRLADYGCMYVQHLAANYDRWMTGWGQPFLIKRWRDTEGYHEADCFDVMLFIFKSAPFESSVKREFGKVWGAINDLNGQVGHLRGELKRRE